MNFGQRLASALIVSATAILIQQPQVVFLHLYTVLQLILRKNWQLEPELDFMIPL